MQGAPIRVQMPDGRVAEFPAGTPQDQITKALSSVSPNQVPRNDAPSPQTQSTTVRERIEAAAAAGDPKAQGLLSVIKQGEVDQRRTNENLPMIGALMATAVTGGAAFPSIIAAGAGAGAGQAIKDTQWDMTAAQRALNAGKSAVGGMLTQGVGSAVSGLRASAQQAARGLWKGAAKITEPIAKTTQTMRAGGSLNAAKDEIAETVLSQGKGTITKANLAALQGTLTTLDDALDAAITSSKGVVSRQSLRNVLRAKAAEFPEGTVTSQEMRDALAKSFEALKHAPVMMTVQEAQKQKRLIYQTFAKSYAADSKEVAKAMAEKTLARGLKEGIEQAAPEAKAINAEMSRQIPAVKAMDRALSRTGNHSFAGLSQMLAAAVTNPGTVALAIMNHPSAASFTAQQLYRAAKALPKDSRTAANIIRAVQAVFGRED